MWKIYFQALDIDSEEFWSESRSKDSSAVSGQILGIWVKNWDLQRVHWSLNSEESKTLEISEIPTQIFSRYLISHVPEAGLCRLTSPVTRAGLSSLCAQWLREQRWCCHPSAPCCTHWPDLHSDTFPRVPLLPVTISDYVLD